MQHDVQCACLVVSDQCVVAHNLTIAACVFARMSSPFSASDLEVDDQFATTVEDNAVTLTDYSADIESLEDSSSHISWFYMRGRTPVRSCCGK